MRLFLLASAALALAACSTATAEKPKPLSAAERAALPSVNKNPFPSTYRPYPSAPTLIRGVDIYDGAGGKIVGGAVLMREGRIVAIGQSVDAPEGATVVDGSGKWVTPGVIDVHSHLGNYATPSVDAHSDGNEVTGPVTAGVWAEHGVWPQDPGFTRALAGGITTLHILPGSANLFGGRGVSLRNVPARTVQGMKFPGAPYTLKMACGENPKRVYGNKGRMPGSRMGNIALDRQTWAKAQEYRAKWAAYSAKVRNGSAKATDAPARDLDMDTLMGVLDGEILVQNHCYRADEMALVLDMAKEFGYKVATFHHGVEAYKVADLLAENGICAAVWADWWGFKLEAYDAIRENAALIDAQPNGCAIIHSDDENGIQRLNQEAGKAMADGVRMGLKIAPEHAIKWLTANPARAMGIGDQTGSLEAGKMADVVVWNSNPFSVYAKTEKVFIDGALLYDASDPKRSPRMDFEIGQQENGFTGGAGQ